MDQARQWRLRAAVMRSAAEKMDDAELKLALLNIATELEKLADQRERIEALAPEGDVPLRSG